MSDEERRTRNEERPTAAGRLTIREIAGKYWVISTVDGVEDSGPSETRKEARGDRHGILQFLRNENRRGYVTTLTR